MLEATRGGPLRPLARTGSARLTAGRVTLHPTGQGRAVSDSSSSGPSPWPAALYVVRHGESSGNVARDAAEAQGLERIDIAERDMDVPLSDTGHDQAMSIGGWWWKQT